MSRAASRSQLAATGSLLVLAFSASALNCDGETGAETPRGDPVAERAVLAALASEVFTPSHAGFRVAAEALREATTTLDDEASLESARAAWREAMAVWQVAEVMQIGPAGGPGRVGGESLRDEIYSWPTVNHCRVDQVLVSEAYAAADFFETSVVNVYGLDALEYLLFYEGAENACPPQVAINDEGTWAALDSDALRSRRAAYAAVVAKGVAEVAARLESSWQADDFADGLGRAGESGSPYESTGEALAELLAAMLYLDPNTKDAKLGVPAGISDCATDTCPEKVELRWAKVSGTAVAANLSGVAQLVAGAQDGAGLSALLVGAGASQVAEDLAADLRLADERVSALGADLGVALTEDLEGVRAAHAALGAVTTRLKLDVAIALTLPLPREGAGDSD